MVKTREVHFETNPNALCETYSDENYKLKQLETDITYGHSVIDIIEGYEDGKPYSRYHYEETDEKDDTDEDVGQEE